MSEIDTLKQITTGVWDVESIGLANLRACHSLMAEWMPKIASAVRDADEKELAAARARVAEIEARLGVATRVAPAPKRERTALDDTDAGMGVGGRAEPTASVESFQDELRALREHNMQKRARRGVA